MKLSDIIIFKITDTGMNGEGIGKYKNFTVFVPFALKNEIIKARIEKIKNNLAFASVLEIIEQSPERQTPPCPYFKICGGCQLQHTNYKNQLNIKHKAVQTTLQKAIGSGHEVKPCIFSGQEFGYRNKIEFAVNGERIGFFEQNSHKIVEIEHCLLAEDWCSKFLEIARKCLKNNTKIKHIVVRKIQNCLSVVFVTPENKPIDVEKWITGLKFFEKISLYQNVNPQKSSKVFGDKFILLHGEKTQKLCYQNIEFEILPESFLQVNPLAENLLYKHISSNIPPKSTVINCYSGAGYLSAILCQNAQSVIGIEISKDATQNANFLKKNNNIKNLENICGDCAKVLPKIIESASDCCVVFDPPRKGLDKKVLETTLNSMPKIIVYVSCNPATLARDLKILKQKYKISSIQPFDMFSQTKHIETVAILKK